MRYNIQQIDLETILQDSLDYTIRCYITDDRKNIMDEVTGIITLGSPTVNSDTDVRRTFSVDIRLDDFITNIEYKLNNWIGYNFHIQIGIYNLRMGQYLYYPCGYYVITSANTAYNAVTNSLSLDLGDWTNRLNGTRNGQVGGSPTITIPVTYNSTKNTLRNSMKGIIEQQGGITDYILEDIGEFLGIPENNSDYLTYRSLNPDWNVIPYDLEFNAGDFVSGLITKIRDLYPNCQTYFDIYNNFCFNMIPSNDSSPVTLDNDYLQSILVAENSESVSYDITSIKNVTEVFGKTYEIDRMSASCTGTLATYTIDLPDYAAYSNYDYIAFTPNNHNLTGTTVRINTLAYCPVYLENTTQYIPADTMLSGQTYVLQLRKINGQFCFYFLGQYQPHALCVLTADENDPLYTKDYFKTRYHCNDIYFRVEKDSPFTIQKLGIILDVKSGDLFDHIQSNSIATENAKYYNKKSSTMNDTVTITTKCIPFIDVYEKVSYRKQQEAETHTYIIKNITHNFDPAGSKTTTLTMYRFYPLY